MRATELYIPTIELEPPTAALSAFRPAAKGVGVADDFARSGSEMSVPSVVGAADPAVAFLAMALGSNFPA